MEGKAGGPRALNSEESFLLPPPPPPRPLTPLPRCRLPRLPLGRRVPLGELPSSRRGKHAPGPRLPCEQGRPPLAVPCPAAAKSRPRGSPPPPSRGAGSSARRRFGGSGGGGESCGREERCEAVGGVGGGGSAGICIAGGGGGGGGCGGSAATKGDPLPRGEACGREPGPSAWRGAAGARSRAPRRASPAWGGGRWGGMDAEPDAGVRLQVVAISGEAFAFRGRRGRGCPEGCPAPAAAGRRTAGSGA